MRKILMFLCLALSGGATGVQAKTLRVATDILPVQSLVAMVMDGAGAPGVVFARNGEPHDAGLKPSQAALLARADVIFWIGPALSPALARSIDNLAADATRVALMQVAGTRLLQLRENPRFEGITAAPAVSVETTDPHVWLDPENAVLWVREIAAVLATADPENAALYERNGAEAQAQLTVLTDRTNDLLAPVRGGNFVVYHDAYTYFEARFDLHAKGAVALSDGSAPGPARVSALRGLFRGGQASCLFLEPGPEPRLLQTLIEGAQTKTAVLDPLGRTLTPGKSLYPAMITDLARGFVSCLH